MKDEILLCPICGMKFVSVNKNDHYCKECRTHRYSAIRRYQAVKRKERQDQLAKEKEKSKPLSISDIVKGIDDYYKKHGEILSYGKYVSMLENGTLKD